MEKNYRACEDCETNISGMPSAFRYCTKCAKEHQTHGNEKCYHCGNGVDSENHSLCHDCFFKRCKECGTRTGNPAFDYCINCYSSNRGSRKGDLSDQIIHELEKHYYKQTARNGTPFFKTEDGLVFINDDSVVVSHSGDKEEYSLEEYYNSL